jgi:hypothetical protein
VARSHAACVAFAGFGNGGWLAVGLFSPDTVASVTVGGTFAGRALAPGLRFSANSPKLHPCRVPSRLTSRSSRPRVVASAMCFALRLHMSAASPQGGLTPALGGRKAFDCFPMLLSPASVGAALRSGSRHAASSVKCVWRAHTAHTLRWSASETVIGVVMFSAADAVASVTSGGEFSDARSGLPASAFGKYIGARSASVSPAT